MDLFGPLRALSFVNSTVFTALLVCWLAPGLEGPTRVLGWTHGWMWIVLTIGSLVALQRRQIPFWLAVVVAVIGGVGPYAGSIGFVVEGRRRVDAGPAVAPR